MKQHDRTYFTLKGSFENVKSFEEEMLKENGIEGILKFYKEKEDEDTKYFYDITGKRALASVMENRNFTGQEICRMLFSIKQITESIQKYLLDCNQLFFSPEHIYVIKEEPENVFFCYVPDLKGNFMDGIRELLRYILTKIDHQEEATTKLGYQLFKVSMEENQNLDALLKIAGQFLDEQWEETEEKEIEEVKNERIYPPAEEKRNYYRPLSVLCIGGIFLLSGLLLFIGVDKIDGIRAGMIGMMFLLFAGAFVLMKKERKEGIN